MESVYFTKVEFLRQAAGGRIVSSILLNLPLGELSYQEHAYTRWMPAIRIVHAPYAGVRRSRANLTPQEERRVEAWRTTLAEDHVPARILRSGKTGFRPVTLPVSGERETISFSVGFRLTPAQRQELLPYCNALDFEPFRGKPVPTAEGCGGEERLILRAVSDSPLPLLTLPVPLSHNEAQPWPGERLYRYLMKQFFGTSKALRRRGVC